MSLIEPPSDFDPHTLAEFIEAELVFSEDDYYSLTEIRNLFPFGNQPSDDELAFLFGEIERRSLQFGSKYPFLVDDRGILIVDNPMDPLYKVLLLLSLKGTPMRTRGEYARSDELFDAISREAFKAEQGPNAQAISFGWPPRGDRPAKFDAAVEWAASAMDIETRGTWIPDHLRDGGVDVIVWRPFPDRRTGFQVTLVQNTVQLSFSKKPYDVRPHNWFLWWKVGTPPQVGFAVPFALPQPDIWWEVVAEAATVVMDRGRIMASLQDTDPSRWLEWSLIEDFVESEVAEVRSAGYFSPSSSLSVGPRRRK